MKSLSDNDLKKATIFDLTDDQSLIVKILGFMPENTREFISNCTEGGRILSLFNLAEICGSKSLLEQLERVFKDEINRMFDE